MERLVSQPIIDPLEHQAKSSIPPQKTDSAAWEMLARKLQHQATSGAASDVSMVSRGLSFGEADAAPAREPWYTRSLGCDALLQLANTYYASRMALMTFTSCLSMVLLCTYSISIESVGFWLWIIFQVTNTILGVSALPNVYLYSILSARGNNADDDATDAARSSIEATETSSPRRGKRSRVTSFSFLRSSFHEIETKLEPFLLKRSKILRLCETIVVVQTMLLYFVILTFTLIILIQYRTMLDFLTACRDANGHAVPCPVKIDLDSTDPPSAQEDHGSSIRGFWLGVFAIVCVYLQTKEFDRLRAHEQLQLGAGLDQDQLDHVQTSKRRPGSSSRISAVFTPDQSEDSIRSSHSYESDPVPNGGVVLDLGNGSQTVEQELRRGLYEAAVNRDLDKASALLDVVARALDSKMAVEMLLLKMYATPTLWLWSFAFTTHNPLHVACRLGDERMVELLLNGGMNPDLLDKTQGEPFSLRVLYEVCQGRRKNITNVLGSPLHVAVAHGHTHVVDVLVAHKANINVFAQSSFYSKSMRVPPIFLADSADVIESLIRHRANFLVVPGKGNAMSVTVLQRAMLNDRGELENVLKEWGADVALTPLHEAAAVGDIATVKHYLSLGIPPDQLGEFHDGVNKRTPLHWASVMGRSVVAAELLRCQAEVNALDARSRTPLHWAARHCRVETVQVLLLAGADPFLCDDEGLTPLAFSAAGGLLNGPCVELFVQYGVAINERMMNIQGDTCLHLALREGHQEAALALIQSGNADLASYNDAGVPAIKCCASAEQLFAIKLISKWVDIVISYDSAYHELAEHLKRGIEESFLTVFMRDVHDNAQESMYRMREASAVVCVLTPGFERNAICMEELSYAKETRVPVMAITIESMNLPEELQVYLFTRQLVPFRDAIIASRRRSSVPNNPGTASSEDTRKFRFKLDDVKFKRSLQNLIDGLRDEVELHDLGNARAVFEPEDQDAMSSIFMPRPGASSIRASLTTSEAPSRLSDLGRSSSATALGTRTGSPRSARGITRSQTTKRRTINDVVKDVLTRRRRSVAFPRRSVNGLLRMSMFLSHGDCHTEFVTKLHEELKQQGIPVTVDSMSHVSSMKERILAAKDAILQCNIFLVVLSEKSVKTELVSDQLAFAEDKGKHIVPIYYTRRPGLVDSTVRELLEANDRPMRIFGNGISYGRGFDELLADLQQEQDRLKRQEEEREAAEWVPISPAAKHAADILLGLSPRQRRHSNNSILV